MSFATKFEKINMALSHPSLFRSKKNYLFILSHMRSRSSLLSHLLGSHPEICGYGELHYDYPTPTSLFKMHLELYKDLNDINGSKYYLDKVLHNSYVISNKILSNPKVHILVLFREPKATIRSLVKMGEETNKPEYSNTGKMLQYYIKRISYLLDISKKFSKVHIVESDKVVKDTANTLTELSDWLNLDSELSENYHLFNKTGKAGHGDPSPSIGSGKIIETNNSQSIELDEDLLEIALQHYRNLSILANR
ncbi:hypothetical protein [Alteromonas macleodii]|jgi:hypothetical protein|uniref:hypothetical protein n=1 Tax=Alteromonas macleodii TaxID=28108 RepID=UPI0031406322